MQYKVAEGEQGWLSLSELSDVVGSRGGRNRQVRESWAPAFAPGTIGQRTRYVRRGHVKKQNTVRLLRLAFGIYRVEWPTDDIVELSSLAW